VRELLKTETRDLTPLCFTASYESDLWSAQREGGAHATLAWKPSAWPINTHRATRAIGA
jgi:hypothetical protein